VSSFLGLAPINRLVAYQTSKFGLCGFTLSLRIDYCRENFGVTLLCPGFVRTPMLETSIDRDTGEAPALLPDWLCTTPEKVARKTIGAIKKNKGLVVITPFARLAWWSMRLSPRLYEWRRRGGWRSHAD
jgi:3-oxoacyl-[acyl-carrier protein] reductase